MAKNTWNPRKLNFNNARNWKYKNTMRDVQKEGTDYVCEMMINDFFLYSENFLIPK